MGEEEDICIYLLKKRRRSLWVLEIQFQHQYDATSGSSSHDDRDMISDVSFFWDKTRLQ
jgi:hypothetical protein